MIDLKKLPLQGAVAALTALGGAQRHIFEGQTFQETVVSCTHPYASEPDLDDLAVLIDTSMRDAVFNAMREGLKTYADSAWWLFSKRPATPLYIRYGIDGKTFIIAVQYITGGYLSREPNACGQLTDTNTGRVTIVRKRAGTLYTQED